MPKSATGSVRSDAGFTLVELMVVLVIIGLMSAVVILAIPDPRQDVVHEAERLAARATAARDDAIVSGRAMRLRIDATGYAIEERRGGSWVATQDRTRVPVVWREDMVAAPQRVTFDTVGGASEAATVVLQQGSARASVVIGGDGSVRLAP